MEQQIKSKYNKLVLRYIKQGKICLTPKIKKHFDEKLFDDGVKDNILIEIDRNDIGQRQFIFTDYARKVLD